jgi:hypothetical protein
MEILGHARIAVTMEIYTAADDGSRRDAISKLNQLLSPDKAMTVAVTSAVTADSWPGSDGGATL